MSSHPAPAPVSRPVAGPPQEAEAQSIDVRDILWRLRRYSWLLVLPVVACLCVAAIYARHSAPVYQAYLVIAVDEPADVSAGLRPYVGGGGSGSAPKEKIALVDGKIHNHSFLKAVAERMGMDKDPILLNRANAAMKQVAGITPAEYALRLAVGQLWGKIVVGAGRGTAIQVTVRDPSPEYARDLAAVIGDALQQQNLQTSLERTQARTEFAKDQAAVWEERVKQAENELQAFQESQVRKGMSGLGSEKDLNLAQGLYRSTQEEVAQLRLQIQSGNDDWRNVAPGASMPVLSSARATELTNQLVRLEQASAQTQLNSGRTDDGDGIRNRITATRQSLFVEFDRLASDMGGNFTSSAQSAASGVALDRAILRSLQSRQEELASTINKYNTNVLRSPADQIRLQTLQENLSSARATLQTIRNEGTSSRIAEAITTSQVGPRLEIVEHPLLPLQPSSLGAKEIFAIAIFLGIVIDVLIVFAGERMAAVIRTVEQAEAEYGLRVVGVVPRILHRPKPGGYFKNNWPKFAIAAVVLVTVLVVVVEITVFPQPTKTGQVQK